MPMLEARGQTAIRRVGLSRPVALAVDDGLIRGGRTFFDFGCGRGTDVGALRSLGIEAGGWDPVHSPEAARCAADVVNLGYVVNVIEDARERRDVLKHAWDLARHLLIVAARLDWDIKATSAVSFGDGVITSRGTFQKFFSQKELQDWIEESLGAQADAAAPGVFYVFRHGGDREAHLAGGSRRRRYTAAAPIPPTLTFDQNRELLEPLLQFISKHGRPPVAGEFADERLVVERLGSMNRAIKLLGRVADARLWEQTAVSRQRDLLVYLALGTLRRKPKFSVLPPDLQADIRHFFGSYAAASSLGRELLFSAGQQRALSEECSKASVGKLMPDALYVHVSAIEDLPVLLRVYEGCARVLLGDVPGATLVKLRRDKPKISYLCYPEFDEDPHPPLKETFVADLRSLHTYHRSYAEVENPPILHRKECFVTDEYPLRETFASLTNAESEAGLLSEAAEIGTRRTWTDRLASRGFATEGHRLLKIRGH
jgi:DNA phosphorothioation-associated putative methyltransferase